MKVNKETLLRYGALFTAMMASGGNALVLREIWVVLTVLLCLPLLNWRIPIKSSRVYIYLWVLAVLLLLLFVQGPGSIVSILSRMMTFLAALLLLEVYLSRRPQLFLADLFAILSVMCVQAILTSVIGNLFIGAFSPVTIRGATYYTLGFVFNFHYVHDEIARYVRPDGFFYEPGSFQIYLSIFLYLVLFWRFSVRWSVLAVVALITVWSTIGLFIATILILISSRHLIFQLRGLKVAVLVLAYVVSVPVVAGIALQNYDQKVNGELRGSFLARQYDFFTGLNIIQQRPLTGIGFGSEAYLNYNRVYGFKSSELRTQQSDDRLNSNGLVQVLYTIGVPLGAVLLLGIYFQILFPHRLPIAIILGGSLYGQSLVFTPFFLLILLSGLVSKKEFYFKKGEISRA